MTPGESIVHRITDGEKKVKKFDGLATIFKPQSEEEHEIHNQIFDSIGKGPINLRPFPLNVAIGSELTTDCLCASSWLTKDHEDFKRMAMNESYPRTQILIQSVQRQVKINMRPQRRNQHANLQGLEHISIVKNAVAE